MYRVLVFMCAVLIAALAAIPGCTPYAPVDQQGNRPPVIQRLETLDLLGVVADLSGSFEETMRQNGWQFMTMLLKNFKRDVAGEIATKVIIAQISGERQGPIFEGSIRSFGKKMGSATDFHDFLKDHAKASGSRVFDSIAQTVDYLTPFVGDNTRAGVFILSDMDDNLSEPGAEERLVKSFAAFGAKGGSVGIYWCDLDKVAKWREHLRRAGVKHFVVESKIAADPTFPNYER
jgi:hypothetical protein